MGQPARVLSSEHSIFCGVNDLSALGEASRLLRVSDPTGTYEVIFDSEQLPTVVSERNEIQRWASPNSG